MTKQENISCAFFAPNRVNLDNENKNVSLSGQVSTCLKEQSHGILSYFDHRQNYREGLNLIIILYKERKTPEIIIKHQGTRIVKNGED